MTTVQRVYVGEATTGAASVSSVVNYALRGSTFVDTTNAANATLSTLSHNLGVVPKGKTNLVLVNVINEQGYVTGDEIQVFPNLWDGTNYRTYGLTCDRLYARVNTHPNATAFIFGKTTNTMANALTGTNWKYRAYVNRGW